MLSNIINNFNTQLTPSPPKDWLKDIGNISQLPQAPMKKSTDSFMGGLVANTGKFLSKSGDNMKWLGQDVASGLTDLAGKAGKGLGAGNMIDMVAGTVDSVAGAVGLEGAEVTTGLDKGLDTVASLPLEYIPGVGTILKGGLKALSLVNKYGGKKSKQQGTDYGLATLGYDKEFNPLADKKYGLFSRKSRKKTDRLTAQQDKGNLMKAVPGFKETQNMYASQNTTTSLADRNYQQMMGGPGTNILAARLGTKVPPVNLRNIANKAEWNKKKKLEEQKKKLEASKVLEKDTKYKDGGLLTKSDKEEVIEEVVEEKKNVIPEGAFHSRLNKYDETIAEHVTRKGIPVITKDGDKITQHAEVERNEIIFHKEATDTIETLHEKYKKAETQKLKDEIAIECGKYVAEQILVNTDDRTGIIEST